MLELKVTTEELYDEESMTFSLPQEYTLKLEHSLLSLSKWESKHEKRFIGNEDLTGEDYFDYFVCMNSTPEISPEVFLHLTSEHIQKIQEYIASSQTGTTFPVDPRNPAKGREQISAELIYYWMIKCGIPWEAENWHLNRLFTLIKIYTVKETQQSGQRQPMTREQQAEAIADRRAENARRRAERNSTG